MLLSKYVVCDSKKVKVCFNKNGRNLDDVSKFKIFLYEGYDLIIFVYGVTRNIFITEIKLFCRCGHVTKIW